MVTFAGGADTLGDCGPATRAELNPYDVALDGKGNLYIANGHWVHKVGRDGVIRRVAGAASPSTTRVGDGGPATSAALNVASGIAPDRRGNPLIAEFHGERIRKVDRHGTITTVAGTAEPGLSADHGRATELTLSNPWGVAVDRRGLLYIADNNAKRVWAVLNDNTKGCRGLAGHESTAARALQHWPLGHVGAQSGRASARWSSTTGGRRRSARATHSS